MTLLEDLYYGNIQPCEYEQSAEARRKLSAMTTVTEKLKDMMPDDGLRTEVDKVFDKQTELIALCERDAFIAGFKLGIRMMVEVLTEW